jgi:hypothetical protein
MAYSDFSLDDVINNFDLNHERVDIFETTTDLEANDWLKNFLSLGLQLALSSGTEKARSEFIVAPILLDLEQRNLKTIFILSGKVLDVDSSRGLTGECDFIITRSKPANVIQTPILALVEAKKQDTEMGLGQCAAQMIAAQLLNQRKQNPISAVFGCVTTGEKWQFLRLVDNVLQIDRCAYYINKLEKVLGILQAIVDFDQNGGDAAYGVQ